MIVYDNDCDNDCLSSPKTDYQMHELTATVLTRLSSSRLGIVDKYDVVMMMSSKTIILSSQLTLDEMIRKEMIPSNLGFQFILCCHHSAPLLVGVYRVVQ